MCIEWVSLSLCMGQHNCCEHVVCLKAVVGFSHLCTVSSESYPHNKNRSFSIPGAFMRYWRTEHSHTSQQLNEISNYFGFEAILCYRNTLETSSINKTKKSTERSQIEERKVTKIASHNIYQIKSATQKVLKYIAVERETTSTTDQAESFVFLFVFFFSSNYKCRYSLV